MRSELISIWVAVWSYGLELRLGFHLGMGLRLTQSVGVRVADDVGARVGVAFVDAMMLG